MMKIKNTRSGKKTSRPTIALLITDIQNPWTQLQWTGVADAAREQNVNLICFTGNSLRSPANFESQANVLYDLANTEQLDGLILWTAGFDNHLSSEEVERFCARYHPLPIVSVEDAVPGIPSILLDQYQAMREVIAHLIEVHGYRHIAFVQDNQPGHWGFRERHRAYVETLSEYGISLNPALVFTSPMTGGSLEQQAKAIRDWLRGKERTGVEAIVAHNDSLALAAWHALQALGKQVGDDIALTGFDDTEEGRIIMSPLTTARPPFYEMGQKAVETVLAMLAGEQAPKQTTLPSELMIRQSCGCLSSTIVQAVSELRPAMGSKTSHKDLKTMSVAQQEEILANMAQTVEVYAEDLAREWAERLLDAFITDVDGESQGDFLRELNRILRQASAKGSDVSSWQKTISVMRLHLLPYLGGESLSRAEDLWQLARVIVGEIAQRAQAYQMLQAERQSQMLREVGASLITTFNVNVLMDVLAKGLSRLGMPSAYLSLYEDPENPTEWSRLILACSENGRVELEHAGVRFSSRQLVPEGLLPEKRMYIMVVKSLYFREHQLGFAMFEIGPRDGRIYDVLRGEISNALMGALLLQEREQAYAEVEKQVEERTVELQREISERQRAQEESARLQQEIIETQKQALQELSTPIIPVVDRIIVMPLIGGIDSVRAKDITRKLLAGIREHRAHVVIIDITGVPLIDSGVAANLNKTIQAARLKGAHTIITGISDGVAETVVDLGIDWGDIETLPNLQTGLVAALNSLGLRLMQ
jgi:DNA-binding LacI/PurR family transcriptional regulator/anti-anti-sigma regulatory factor